MDPVGRNYTSGLDVRQAIMKGVTPIFSTPISPAAGADSGTVRKWEKGLMASSNEKTYLKLTYLTGVYQFPKLVNDLSASHLQEQ